MIKTLSRVEINETYLNKLKAICKKLTSNILLSGEKLFPLISGKTQGSLFSPLLLNIGLEDLATVIRQENEIKGIQIGREKVKLLLFTDDMILCRENPKDAIRNLLELIHKFRKVAGYKIHIQKSVAF